MDEHRPLISQNNSQHFECFAGESCYPPSASDDATVSGLNTTLTQCNGVNDLRRRGGTVFQTALNIAKLCMGTGTLALPFAAQQGGLIFNMVGLGVIVVWNYFCADCLLRCLDYLPPDARNNDGSINIKSHKEGTYDAIQKTECMQSTTNRRRCGPPEGTTTYGIVAWYAFGKTGLVVLDLLMIMLFVGLLISYEAAMISFLDGINMSTGFTKWDKIFPGVIVAILSCAEDISFLSKFSAVGLIALAIAFLVISWEGIKENGWISISGVLQLNLWPDSLSSASSWFGVIVFGYGVVPVIYNIEESMAEPQFIGKSTMIGLSIAYLGYLYVSDGIRILFVWTHSFDGDVLQALPDSLISFAVRLLMTFVVAVTAPFIVVPCGEMIEGKLSLDSNSLRNRVVVRCILCTSCTLLAAFVPGFVHIISFVGCFCVSMTGFVLPPLFSLQLKRQKCGQQGADLLEVWLLLLGLFATSLTSILTFHSLVDCSTKTITAGDHM